MSDSPHERNGGPSKMKVSSQETRRPANQDDLAKLKRELYAIDLWDSDYYQHPELHDKITIDAYRCRQVRRPNFWPRYYAFSSRRVFGSEAISGAMPAI